MVEQAELAQMFRSFILEPRFRLGIQSPSKSSYMGPRAQAKFSHILSQTSTKHQRITLADQIENASHTLPHSSPVLSRNRSTSRLTNRLSPPTSPNQ